ncbi:MAG: glycosyltransferase family 4 protein [Sphingomonadaceae bacterium]|nr:glycosyltransferase family 4 protein [Sphingomonadaceae bacterium]
MMGAPTPRIHICNRFYFPDNSATAQIAADLGRDLAARGWTVIAHASRHPYADGPCLPLRTLADGVDIRRLRTTNLGRASGWGRGVDYLSYHIAIFIRLLTQLRRGDIIICKTDPPMLSVTVALAAALRGARIVHWLQDLFPEVADQMLPAPVTRLLGALRNWSLRRGVKAVTIGALMADKLAGIGLRSDAIAIIPNWADANIRPVPRDSNQVRRDWGISTDIFTVAYSGNLGFAHDYSTILAAAEKLRDRPKILFLMIGGGAGMRAMEQAAAERALPNIRFLPYQPRESLSQSLGAGDLHWLSLRPAMEGLIVPSKLYGIIAAQRPFLFIGDGAGEVARFVAQHGGGCVIAEGDDDAAAETIVALANDPAAYSREIRATAAASRRYAMVSALKLWDELLGELSRHSG